MDLKNSVFWWIVLYRIALHGCATEKGNNLTLRGILNVENLKISYEKYSAGSLNTIID